MPEPLSIAAAVTAAAGVADRLLDVTGARKRLAAAEQAIGEVRALVGVVAADVAKLRADVEALGERLRRRAERSDTGSQRATVIPVAPPPPDVDRRLGEAERRLAKLEEQAGERDGWEREIAVAVARIEERLRSRLRRAEERGSDG